MEILEPRVSKQDKVEKERRADIRRKALKGAKLAFNNGYGAMECVVRNLSSQGARLSFGDAAAVPSHFQIRISDDAASQTAVVRWRYGNEVGIKIK